MNLLLATDIFGVTTAVRSMWKRLGGSGLLLSPYDDERAFTDEKTAYSYFSEHVGMERYVERLRGAMQKATFNLALGFSVGATALWIALDITPRLPLDKAVLFYGSRIRDYLHLTPHCPTKLIFAEREVSFAPEDIVKALRERSIDASIVPGTRHGFMNELSPGFCRTSFEEHLGMLGKGIRESAFFRLAKGTTTQRKAFHALTEANIMGLLAPFDATLAGTIPLDIDIPGSDLDIICQVTDAESFASLLLECFGDREGFSLTRCAHDGFPTIIARFVLEDFPVEVFGQPRPVTEQNAYRHMSVEERLLRLGGEPFRNIVREMKRDGMKTEPAFARLLHLPGDPYEALLALSSLDENSLTDWFLSILK